MYTSLPDARRHTPQTQIARENINDQRIPVTGLQLSVFFNVALLIYVLDMKIPIVLLAVLIAALAIFHLFDGAPFDFAGFRFVSTSCSTTVYKKKVKYVPLEKHVTHYMVKEKHVSHYIVKDAIKKTIKKTIKSAIKPEMGSAVLLIASKFNQQVRSQAELEQWCIDTISLSPYEDVEPSKRVILLQWLDEFSTLDPFGDLLTSKPRDAPKQLGDTSAHAIDRPFDFPTVFTTNLEEVTSYNETSESFDFPAPHPDAPAGSEAYKNGKAIDNDYAPQEIIDNYNYNARWMQTSKHNVFIDIWISGRWAIRTESTHYILQWHPKAQIWFCADFGFGLAGDGIMGEGKLTFIFGLDPDNDASVQGPQIWNAGSAGPGWEKAKVEMLVINEEIRKQNEGLEKMWEEVNEWRRQDEEETRRAEMRKEYKVMKKQMKGQIEKLHQELRLHMLKQAAKKKKITNKPGRFASSGKKPSAAPPRAQQPHAINLFASHPSSSANQPKNSQSSPRTPGAQPQSKKKTTAEIAAENKARAKQTLKEWATKGVQKEKPEMGKKHWE